MKRTANLWPATVAAKVLLWHCERCTPRGMGAVALLILLAGLSPADAQSRSSASPKVGTDPRAATPPRSVFLELGDRAEAAAKGGRTEIDAFVNYSLIRSIAYPVGPSIRSRITRAEAAYREDKQRAISDADVVSAINRAASRYWAPSFVRTNEAQVTIVRQRLNTGIPHLEDLTRRNRRAVSGGVSPAHATLILTFLLTQKLTNGLYQIDADAWVSETRHNLPGVDRMAGQDRPTRRPQVWALPGPVQNMMAEPPSDTSAFTILVHRMLDDLGVSR